MENRFKDIEDIEELRDYLNEFQEMEFEAHDLPTWGNDPQDLYGYVEGYWSYCEKSRQVLVSGWKLMSYEEFFNIPHVEITYHMDPDNAFTESTPRIDQTASLGKITVWVEKLITVELAKLGVNPDITVRLENSLNIWSIAVENCDDFKKEHDVKQKIEKQKIWIELAIDRKILENDWLVYVGIEEHPDYIEEVDAHLKNEIIGKYYNQLTELCECDWQLVFSNNPKIYEVEKIKEKKYVRALYENQGVYCYALRELSEHSGEPSIDEIFNRASFLSADLEKWRYKKEEGVYIVRRAGRFMRAFKLRKSLRQFAELVLKNNGEDILCCPE